MTKARIRSRLGKFCIATGFGGFLTAAACATHRWAFNTALGIYISQGLQALGLSAF